VSGPRAALIEFDVDGDGISDFIGTSLVAQPFIFATPGLYFPRATVTDAFGAQTIITTVLEVEAGAAVVTRLQTVWDSFKARLAAGDVAGALAYLSPGIQPKFEQIFVSLGANLPSAAGVLGTPLILEQIDDLAEATVVRQEGGSRGFISFISAATPWDNG
jgi:hypothetical protein